MAGESTDCTALLFLRLEVVYSRGKKQNAHLYWLPQVLRLTTVLLKLPGAQEEPQSAAETQIVEQNYIELQPK